jgi:uncharacterized protein (TIGR04222 family)
MVVAGFGLAVGPQPVASAPVQSSTGERIQRFAATVDVARDGTVRITEEITYDFANSPNRHGIERVIPVRFRYDDVKKNHDRVTPLVVESVDADVGAPADYEIRGDGDDRTIRIGDADIVVSGVHTYEITYRLTGVLNHFDDHEELYLNITGNGWRAPIDQAEAEVSVPAPIGRITCFAGPLQSSIPCDKAEEREGRATFAAQDLGRHEGLTVVVGFPTGVIDPVPSPILSERWTVGRAFAVRPDTVVPAGALAAAAVGGFALLVTRVGRDRRFAGSPTDVAFGNVSGQSELAPLRDSDPIPVEFVPPDGLRPGQVGTLIDEQANTLDVTATIIDLAVRGYLRITEIPKEGWFGSTDWELTSLKPGAGLKEYENTLLTALFATGPQVKLSDLKGTFASHLKAVADQLYEDMLANGWYRDRPDRTRTKAAVLAVAVIVAGIAATVLLAMFTSYALVGLPFVLFGLLLVFAYRVFPSRTAKGYAALRRVRGFKRFIDESEKERARFAEQQHLFSEYLGYAVVFGAVDKWARTFAGIDGELPTGGWYVGAYPFNVITFTGAVNGFTVATSGTISSVPASSGGSGFGGGGFSGGGVGGGGGGSW